MVTALQSLSKKLAPLNIYDIREGTNIFAELSAYAYAINKHRQNTQIALRECFISTAESYGIEMREKVFGNPREDYTLSQRREMLKLRRGLGDSDFTLAGFDKFMNSLGAGSYNLLEMYSTYEAAVTMFNTFSNTDAEWIENQINLFLPAHIIVYVYYGGPTFSEIDTADLTYSAFDTNDKTWRQIENNQ